MNITRKSLKKSIFTGDFEGVKSLRSAKQILGNFFRIAFVAVRDIVVQKGVFGESSFPPTRQTSREGDMQRNCRPVRAEINLRIKIQGAAGVRALGSHKVTYVRILPFVSSVFGTANRPNTNNY